MIDKGRGVGGGGDAVIGDGDEVGEVDGEDGDERIEFLPLVLKT